MDVRKCFIIALLVIAALVVTACGAQFLPPDLSAQIAEETKVAGYTPTFTPVPTSTFTPTPIPPTPTLTPTPTPFVAITQGTNVRMGPATSHPIMGVVFPSKTFPVNGQNPEGTWYQIQFGPRLGWVSAEVVEINNASSVSTIEITPAP